MTRYAIDPPTLLHLADNDVRVDPGHQLVAPNALRSEALQLLYDEVRSGQRSEREALAAHQHLTEIKVRLLGDRVSRGTAWRIAREQGWERLRDAEYVAVTTLQADALVALDDGLRQRAEPLVTLAPLGALLAP